MQQSKVAFIALARELLDKVSLSLALERSGNVSSARTRGGAKANPVFNPVQPTNICMWVGLTWVQPGFAKTGSLQIECGCDLSEFNLGRTRVRAPVRTGLK